MALYTFEQAALYARRQVDENYQWFLTVQMADCVRPQDFYQALAALDKSILFMNRIEYLNERAAKKLIQKKNKASS